MTPLTPRFALLALALLTACAQTPPAPPREVPATQPEPAPTPVAEVAPAPPETVNFTPFPGNILMCDGACSARVGRDYYTWNVKLSFDIDRQGRLSVAEPQEPALTVDDDPAEDGRCTAKGSPGNQRNTWFPDTAIFVRGGKLISVRAGKQKPLKLATLSGEKGGALRVRGKGARATEWVYQPCVGAHRVASGARLDGFLPREAVLAVKPEKGALLRLSLPSPTEPYVLLRYHSGAMIPVPMRPVIVTVDLVERRLVAYFQTTYADQPPLRKVELRAVLPGQAPAPGETEARFRERSEAVLGDLRRCPAPTTPIEACATPERTPDGRIFAP